MTSAESFHLPKEFEGFVSSADDLLQQFQRIDTEDAVTVQIYPDRNCAQAELLDLLDELSIYIKRVSEPYIWFKDSLKIALIVPDDKKELAHFCGIVKFSDSIEDEWFVTFIALLLSENFTNLSICVTDTDGQFLLIEAADFIPDWIDPENCENRLWIRQGKVHIVPLDEAGRNVHDCGIKLSAALEAVQNRPNDTVASRHVQAAIAQRTTAVYPHKAAADAHTTYCTVSGTIASLLEQCPSLVSVAVNTFCLPPAAGSNKNYIAAMTKFGSDLSELRTVPVRFTRLQYAKMMYQNFHIPKKFHDASRVVGGAENRKLTESFDIGCRLMCGIESAYQRSKAENVKKSGSSKSSSQYLREIEMKNNMKSEIFYSSQHRENSDFQAMIDTLLNTNDIKEKEEKMQRNKSPSTGDINNSNSNSNQNSSLSEMKESKNLLKKYHSLSRTLEPDSDSWMFLSPEELDAEMEARVMKYKGNDAGNKTSTVLQETEKGILRNDLLPPKNSESGQQNTNNDVHQKDNKSVFNDTTETNQLQKMLDGMKAFISTKSDVGGIGSSKVVKNTPSSAEDKTVIEEKNKSEIKQNYSNSNSNISSDNNAGDGDDTNEELEIDMEKLMGYINNTNISSSIPIITTHSTEQKKEDHSLNLENPPLAHYFYDEDLIEMSSDDSSDDSDDEDEEEFESQNNQKNTRNEVSILSENIRIIDHDGTGHTETVENIRNARKTKETDLISTIGIRTVQLATASSSARGSKAQWSRSAQLNAQGTDRREDTAVGGDIMSSVVGISKLTLLSPAASESSSPSCVTAEESIIISSNNSNSSSLSLSHQGSDISNSKPLSDSGHSQHRPSSSAALCDTRQSSDPGATHSSSRTGAADRTAQSVESGDESDDGDSFYDDSETDSDDEPLDEPTAGGRGGEGGGARSMNPSYEHDPLPSHVESGGNDVEEEEENVGAYLKEYEQIMESELASSTLLESFERYSRAPKTFSDSTSNDFEDMDPQKAEGRTSPEEVDVDLNFLKYLLESHASQLGAAGPATQLFSQLGIQLPHLPPMNVKTDTDAAN